MKLRPHQNDCLNILNNAFIINNCKRGLISICCGGGKSIIICEFIKNSVNKYNKICFVTSRIRLIMQFKDTITQYGIIDKVKLLTYASFYKDENYFNSDLVVFDESHNLVSNVNKKKTKALLKYPNKSMVFFTATPTIINNPQYTSMYDKSIFGDLIFEYTFSQGMDDGFILRPNILFVKSTETTEEVLLECNENEIDKCKYNCAILDMINKCNVVKYLRKTVLFFSSKQEVHIFIKCMESKNINIPIYPLTSEKEVSRLFENFINNNLPDIFWILTIKILDEGIDIPSIDSVVFIKQRTSESTVIQNIGRAIRTCANKNTAYIFVPTSLESDRFLIIKKAYYKMLSPSKNQFCFKLKPELQINNKPEIITGEILTTKVDGEQTEQNDNEEDINNENVKYVSNITNVNFTLQNIGEYKIPTIIDFIDLIQKNNIFNMGQLILYWLKNLQIKLNLTLISYIFNYLCPEIKSINQLFGIDEYTNENELLKSYKNELIAYNKENKYFSCKVNINLLIKRVIVFETNKISPFLVSNKVFKFNKIFGDKYDNFISLLFSCKLFSSLQLIEKKQKKKMEKDYTIKKEISFKEWNLLLNEINVKNNESKIKQTIFQVLNSDLTNLFSSKYKDYFGSIFKQILSLSKLEDLVIINIYKLKKEIILRDFLFFETKLQFFENVIKINYFYNTDLNVNNIQKIISFNI